MARVDRARASRLVLAAAIALCAGHALAQEPIVLGSPVACEIGKDCLIQNYVDADSGPASQDHMCGTLSYDGHNGTDFRLPTMAAQRRGVDVLAAADGRVLRLRDDVPDASVRETGRAAVKDQECGNGLVVAHADGWQTQYCHMTKGSLKARTGERVRAGQALGQIGLSGLTEYPHLHFIVRHRDKVVDPFAFGAPSGACGGGRSLWRPALGGQMAYKPRAVLNSGFATGPVTMASIEGGGIGSPGRDAPALVAYVRAIGLKAGDVQILTLKRPSGQILAERRAPPLKADQAQSLTFAGLRKPPQGWGFGAYRAGYVVLREGGAVLEGAFDIELR